jgi:hypothetical protein
MGRASQPSATNRPGQVTATEVVHPQVAQFLEHVTAWATDQPHISAVLLVGSYARGTARDDSDIDLILIADMPDVYTSNTGWVTEFGSPERLAAEDWGKVTSIRVWYQGGPEVEFGIAGSDWGGDPEDRGDAQVVKSGYRILYDATGALGHHLEVLSSG